MSDSNIATTEREPGRELALPSSGNVIQSILSAAKDKDVDADKVKTLYELATGMMDRERAATFNASKIAAIRDMPAIYKRGKSDKHRYAKFEDLHRAAMPVLARNGLTLDFNVGSDGTAITVQPVLRHENGWVEEGGVMKAPPDQGPGRSAVQAIGSTTSYLKRHSMKAILNIIEDGEDNDGGYGHREGEQRNDRQDRMILDAEASAAAGDYADWFGRLAPKDKAFLISIGINARLGGGAALPPPAGESPIGRDDRPIEPEDAEFEPVDERPSVADERPADPPIETKPAAAEPEAEPDVTTPDGWTEAYARRLRAAGSIEDVDAIVKSGATAIRKLSEAHPKLYEKADAAVLDARERLTGVTDNA